MIFLTFFFVLKLPTIHLRSVSSRCLATPHSVVLLAPVPTNCCLVTGKEHCLLLDTNPSPDPLVLTLLRNYPSSLSVLSKNENGSLPIHFIFIQMNSIHLELRGQNKQLPSIACKHLVQERPLSQRYFVDLWPIAAVLPGFFAGGGMFGTTWPSGPICGSPASSDLRWILCTCQDLTFLVPENKKIGSTSANDPVWWMWQLTRTFNLDWTRTESDSEWQRRRSIKIMATWDIYRRWRSHRRVKQSASWQASKHVFLTAAPGFSHLTIHFRFGQLLQCDIHIQRLRCHPFTGLSTSSHGQNTLSVWQTWKQR